MNVSDGKRAESSSTCFFEGGQSMRQDDTHKAKLNFLLGMNKANENDSWIFISQRNTLAKV